MEGNDTSIDTITAERYLIRGAVRDDIVYPNREWGYGKMNIYQTFVSLRGTQ